MTTATTRSSLAFEPMSKRRRGFPSETQVKRGSRIVHGDKELLERFGRNELCRCGSGLRFQGLLSAGGKVRRISSRLLCQG